MARFVADTPHMDRMLHGPEAKKLSFTARPYFRHVCKCVRARIMRRRYPQRLSVGKRRSWNRERGSAIVAA